MAKVGIFAGTFDPVHAGHLAFAATAAEEVGLSEVVFLPEATPRHKTGVTDLQHRAAMLRLAVAGNPMFSVLTLPLKQFTLGTTWPRLQAMYENDELYLLVGGDVLQSVPSWPQYERFADQLQFIAGRQSAVVTAVRGVTYIDHDNHEHSSSRVREGEIAPLVAIKSYIEQANLYA